ncbi:MAG: hypothetical protein RR454_00300 [Clostridia bacterium]
MKKQYRKKKMSPATQTTIISIVLLIVFLCVGGGLIYNYKDKILDSKFFEMIKKPIDNIINKPSKNDFSVNYDGKALNENSEALLLKKNQVYRFDVNNKDKKGIAQKFSVKVVPNKQDFKFKVNGVETYFSTIEDLTMAFDIKLYENYFTFQSNFDILEMLKIVLKTDNIQIDENIYPSLYDLFKFQVKIGEETIEINLREFVPITKITFDKGTEIYEADKEQK